MWWQSSTFYTRGAGVKLRPHCSKISAVGVGVKNFVTRDYCSYEGLKNGSRSTITAQKVGEIAGKIAGQIVAKSPPPSNLVYSPALS